jgi:DNA-binding transcriptional ArsR family regulator
MPKRQTTVHEDGQGARDAVVRQIEALGEASTSDLSASLGVTRQAVQYHLRALLESGLIRRSGTGRSTRYQRTFSYAKRWRIGDAQEDEVWADVASEVDCLASAAETAKSILRYAATEMVNNAIDHSGGTSFEVAVRCFNDVVAIDVADDGVGAFAHLRERLGLPDTFAAIQQLSKGKQTTAPDRHTGEGIFFTSKAVDRFELESSGLRWVVDNLEGDQAVGDSPRRTGTLVKFELNLRTDRQLKDVFEPYTSNESLAFDTTRTVVRLFARGQSFISRSEAKRLANGLERFDNVIVDFQGVKEVGQGFVDELFRVWQREHPDVKLTPANMSLAVEQMVRRGLAD